MLCSLSLEGTDRAERFLGGVNWRNGLWGLGHFSQKSDLGPLVEKSASGKATSKMTKTAHFHDRNGWCDTRCALQHLRRATIGMSALWIGPSKLDQYKTPTGFPVQWMVFQGSDWPQPKVGCTLHVSLRTAAHAQSHRCNTNLSIKPSWIKSMINQ
jgi:hypothetical protein